MSADAELTIVSSSASDAGRPSDLRPGFPPQQDPFGKLPSETIVEIFSYTYPIVEVPQSMRAPHEYTPRQLDPEIISTVCKRWRAIMLSNPSLWATLTITARRIMPNDWTRWGFSQLRSCLKRSGAYPLDIRLEGNGIPYTTAAFTAIEIVMQYDRINHGILDMIMLYSERWRSIAFTFPLLPELIQKLNKLDDRLPLLENLSITDSRHFDDQLTSTAFRTAPKLKSFSITDLSSQGLEGLRRIQIAWTHISELTFRDSDFSVAGALCEILEWASGSLTSLIFWGFFDAPVAGSAKRCSRTTTLTRLRRLYIAGRSTAILDVLICPSLEDLELDCATEQGITSFLERSSCALKSFKLNFSLSAHPTTFQAILQNSALSTLKCISLRSIPNESPDILDFDTHHLFPSLETLSLYLAFRRHNDPVHALYTSRIGPLSQNLHSYEQSDRHSCGPQHLASQIEILRRVVDSRTRTTALNQPASFVGDFQSSEVQYAGSSLKNCLFRFELPSNGPEADDYWDKDPIYALQSLCLLRKIFVSVEISYPWDHIPRPFYGSDSSSESDTTE